MNKEIIRNQLTKFDYKFIERYNAIIVKLGFSLEVVIEFTDDNKVLIKDRLKNWNLLTGVFEMSLKNSLIFNALFALFYATVYLFIQTTSESKFIETATLFLLLIGIFWILLWTPYFVIKAENFRRFIENIRE